MQQAAEQWGKRYVPYQGPLIYCDVKASRPCRICGKPDWCSYSANEEVSYCARTTEGADAISKNGWGIYFHTDGRESRSVTPQQKKKKQQPETSLAPLEIRDAVYSELLQISPVSNFTGELIEGPNGLIARGFTSSEFRKFGALPASISDRAHLARELRLFVRANFPAYAEKLSHAAVVGVPGFWQDQMGAVQLWVNYEEPAPLLVIPYRDPDGRIQVCQVRKSGPLLEGQKRYSWLATPKLPYGVSSGSSIHHTFTRQSFHRETPIVITEGALKAEALVSLRPKAQAVATSGVTCSHDELIQATRGQLAYVAFDADHRDNDTVCRHLGRLLAAREQDAERLGLNITTKVIVWDTSSIRAKGIDDAALNNLPLKSISIREWYSSLPDSARAEVEKAWQLVKYQLA